MKIGAAKILLSCFLLFAVFGIALADLTNPLGTCDLSCLAGKITKFLFIISIPIVSIMVLVGGFPMVTGGGHPVKF